ncbi:MAG: histidine kinase [Paenibacillaceae bacterium]
MKRWKVFNHNFSLRQKIIVTSIVCLIVPVASIVLISSSFTKNIMKDQALSNATESLNVVRSHITNTVNDMIGVANYMQFDTDSIAILRNPSSERTYEQFLKMNDKLKALSNNYDSGMYVTMLTTDRRYYTNYSFYRFEPLAFFDESWFSNLDKLSPYQTYSLGIHRSYIAPEIQNPYMTDPKSVWNPYVITIARTLRTTATSAPYAYIIVSVDEKIFSSVMTNYTDQNMMLIAPDGTVLSNKEQVGWKFPHMDKLTGSEQEPIITFDGESFLLVKQQLPFQDWLLVSLIPYNNVLSEINQVYETNFVWQIGFSMLFLVILIYLLRQFTKPVIQLGHVASSIEAGNLSIRSHVRGGDEIGRLGKSFDHMLDRVEEMIEQITYEQERKRKAELSMLQAQIHPHFLFNILNSIRMRILLRGDQENSDLLSSLSKLLRMTIQQQEEMIIVRDEADIAERYMQLMQSTMKQPFQYKINLASDTLMELVPRFILQPIIENALIHGIDKRAGFITIRASIGEQDRLIISVHDDGIGMSSEQLAKLKFRLRKVSQEPRIEDHINRLSGIGLANVFDRLRMIYGDHVRIDITSELGQGTLITINIPRKEGDSYAEGINR